MTQLANEILIAYVDGELGPAQKRVVDGVLAADQVTFRQFKQLELANKRLSQVFSSMLDAEVKQDVVDRMNAHAPIIAPPIDNGPGKGLERGQRNIFMPAVAASFVLVVLGAVGGYMAGNKTQIGELAAGPFGLSDFWTKEQKKAEEERSRGLITSTNAPKTTAATSARRSGSSTRWYESIARRHKVDAAALLDQFVGKSRNRELALFQFSRTDIAPSLIPFLREEELTFVGASPVQIGDRKYARLAYRDLMNGAIPVGLYVGRANGGSLTLERGYREKDNYVRWTQGKRSYMLIGSIPHWRLIVLSVAIQRQLVL